MDKEVSYRKRKREQVFLDDPIHFQLAAKSRDCTGLSLEDKNSSWPQWHMIICFVTSWCVCVIDAFKTYCIASHRTQPRSQGFSVLNWVGGKRPWHRLVTCPSYTPKSWVSLISSSLIMLEQLVCWKVRRSSRLLFPSRSYILLTANNLFCGYSGRI